MQSMKKHIRFDWAIKRLLRQKANFDVLEGFLSELLKEDVTIKEILESESNKEREDSKFNKVDILVKNTLGDLMLIEVQNERENDFFHRMNFGQAKLLIEHIDEGDKYDAIKKVYSVNIVYFDLGQGQDYVYTGTTNFIGVHNNDVLELNASQKEAYPITKVSDIFTTYYLLKVNKFDDVATDTLDEWIYFLKNNEIKDEFKAKGIKAAQEKLRVDNLPIEEKKNYERFLDSKRIEMGVYESAIAEGKSMAAQEIEEAKQKEKEAKQKEQEAIGQKEEERKQKEKAQTEERKMLLITATTLHESGMTLDEVADKLQKPLELIRDVLNDKKK